MNKGKTIAFNPLSMPTYVMANPAGSTCNLNCSYCYYLEKEKLYPNRKKLQMSEDLLEKYIEGYINAQPVPEVLFTWHGGETLLAGIPFYRKAIALQRKYGRGRQIEGFRLTDRNTAMMCTVKTEEETELSNKSCTALNCCRSTM